MNTPHKYALLGALILAFSWTTVLAQQTAKKFASASYGDIHYLEHLPSDYSTSSKQYPLIIFLHGTGQQGPANGTRIDSVRRLGLPKFIEAGDDMTFTVDGQTFSFIVISPQLQYNVGAWPNEYIDAVVQATLNRYRIDRSRIYLTGLSLGGGGTWRYGAQEADFLAAIAPLAGTQSPNRGFAENIAAENLPVWIFHGGNDSSPPSAQASLWASYLNEAGADPAPKVTIYPGLGHESAVWDNAYRTDHEVHNPNLYEWFLQHQRGSTTPPPPVNQPPVARAGADVTIQLPISQVKLNGGASSDPDGSIAAYAWTKTSGPSGASLSGQTTSQLTVNGLTVGSYTFQLQVTDNQGATSTDEVRVVVQAPPTPVSLWLEAECSTVGSSWQTITDAAASNGRYVMYPQGNVSKNPPSGNAADQVTFTVNVSQAASYFLLARIRAIDNARNSFWIKIDNRSWIEWWEGMTLSQSFAWNLAPGGALPLSAGSHTITFAYREGGTQLDKLVLSTSSTLPSGLGGAAPSCTTMPPPPASVVTVDAGIDKTVSPDTTLMLSPASVKGPNPFRVYLWEKVSGPTLTLITRGANATLTNLQVGSYEFKFTATDSEGNSGFDEVKVIVTASSARTADSSPKPTVELAPDALTSVLVYPNPADGSLKVSLGTKQPASLSLSDLSGRMLFHQRAVPSLAGEITIATAEFPEGMYLLRVEQQDQIQLTKLLIKH